jgi:hypothetical protein
MNEFQTESKTSNWEGRPGMERQSHMVSEETSRLSGRGSRLSFMLTYAFIALAMCLLLVDMFHLSAQPVNPATSVHHNVSRAH